MERQTLDDIYRSYFADVYRYLLSLCHQHDLAEDLVQETFLRAYLYLEQCPAEKIRPWLFRVAHNASVDAVRKRTRSEPTEPGFFERIAGDAEPETEVVQRERLLELQRIVDSLPERQRQAISLVDFGGLSYEEAADAMDITPAYFKVLLFRARQKARKIREGDERDE